MSEEIKEYPFDVKFDESALKTFNDLIKEKGIRHFKLESDLYGILDVVSYEEYEKLQQKVEQLEKEIDRLNNIIDEFEDWLGKQRIRNCEWDNFVIKDTRLGIPITYLLNKLKELKENNKDV